MEAGKENIRHNTTRIPLPKKPLLALPINILEKDTKKRAKNENVPLRRPLNTLNNQSSNIINAPGPSRVKGPKKILTPITTKIPLMSRSEDLDEGFKVSNKGFEVSRLAVIPEFKSPILVEKCTRNKKSSFETPDRREGLSPVIQKIAKVVKKVKRQSKFNDSLQERLLSPDFLKKSYMACFTRDYTDDMFEYLLKTERKPLCVPHTSSMTRACIINWLMKINGADGDPAVIQSACWYLDSILGTEHVHLEKLQLVAAACYWIGQKLHGPIVSAMDMVKYTKHAFTAENLRATEREILRRLKFPLQPVVPYDFVNHFSWWCNNLHPGKIEVAATFLCMSGLIVDKALCEEFPSVIAAAAVRNALLLLKMRHLMIRLQMCPLYISIEKKATDFFRTCLLLRSAVRTISAPIYEYKAPFQHYGVPPNYMAQKIIIAANELSETDSLFESS